MFKYTAATSTYICNANFKICFCDLQARGMVLSCRAVIGNLKAGLREAEVLELPPGAAIKQVTRRCLCESVKPLQFRYQAGDIQCHVGPRVLQFCSCLTGLFGVDDLAPRLQAAIFVTY